MNNKEVRFSVGVDSASAEKTRRVIQQITEDVKRLVDTTRLAGANLVGGGFGIKVGGLSGVKGAGSGQLGTRLQQTGGGVTDGLTRAVQNSAALFKGAAAGSKDAFRVMTDSLKRHVDDSSKEIGRLENSLARLERRYDRLKTRQASGAGGRLTDAAVEQAQGQYYGVLGQLDNARSNRAKLVEATKATQLEAVTVRRRTWGQAGRGRQRWGSRSSISAAG